MRLGGRDRVVGLGGLGVGEALERGRDGGRAYGVPDAAPEGPVGDQAHTRCTMKWGEAYSVGTAEATAVLHAALMSDVPRSGFCGSSAL